MFGDEQGSAQVMMQVTLDASGAMLPASVTDPISRNAYTPYGAVRGVDNLSIDHGWLNKIADTDTGLTYLGARYYDPLTSRFISPDPLMNPMDPRTLDAFMYANNNPVLFSDPTGLTPRWDPNTGTLSKEDFYADGGYLKTKLSMTPTTDVVRAWERKAAKAKSTSTSSGSPGGSTGWPPSWIGGASTGVDVAWAGTSLAGIPNSTFGGLTYTTNAGNLRYKPLPTSGGSASESLQRTLRDMYGDASANKVRAGSQTLKISKWAGAASQGLGPLGDIVGFFALQQESYEMYEGTMSGEDAHNLALLRASAATAAAVTGGLAGGGLGLLTGPLAPIAVPTFAILAGWGAERGALRVFDDKMEGIVSAAQTDYWISEVLIYDPNGKAIGCRNPAA